jgi:hypothetical protein
LKPASFGLPGLKIETWGTRQFASGALQLWGFGEKGTPVDMDLSVARPMKMSEQATVEYELDMLRFAWERINTATANGVTDWYAYMYLECFLLHYRIVIQLLAANKPRSDDVSLATFFAQVKKNKRDEIERIAKPLLRQYSDSISKYLAHCTTLRHTRDKAWRANEMYFELLPAIQLLREAFGLPQRSDEHACPLQMSNHHVPFPARQA